MRPSAAVLAFPLFLIPSLAAANPYAAPLYHFVQPEAGTGAATEPPQPTVDPSLQPTSSKAPPSEARPEIEQPAPEPEPEPEAPPPEPEPLPEKSPDTFNRHGVGVVGGITIVPTFIVDNYVASMTNSLCRGDTVPTGKFASNLNRVGGCNFHIGGEYIYRPNKILDVAPQLGYQRVKAPDGLWLDRDECPDGDGSADCNYSAADYTQVDVSFLYIAVDLMARGTVLKTPEFAWQIGGGGGLGIGIISGIGKGVFQTPLGDPGGSPDANGAINQGTCGSFADYADFTRCTPHWWKDDPDENGGPPPAFGTLRLDDTNMNTGRFVDCTKDKCNEADLDALGRKKNTDVPPVIPYVKLAASMRFLIKDTFGINLEGGWNTGFFFGGSLQYFFGPK